MWLLFTFFSMVARAVYGVMTKVLSTRTDVSAYTQSFLLLGICALFSVVTIPILGGLSGEVTSTVLILSFIIIVCSGIGNITYFVAIKDLTSGTAQIVFSSIIVFNTLLSVMLLGLRLDALNVLGIVVLLFAVVLVVSGKVELHWRGVLLMTLSAFAFSGFQLANSRISALVSAPTYLLITYIGTALVVLLYKFPVIISDIKKRMMSRKVIGIFVLTALFAVINFVFAYYAYRLAAEPPKVAILINAQVVIAVLLSYIFLYERGHVWRKVLAAILVIVATWLIKL